MGGLNLELVAQIVAKQRLEQAERAWTIHRALCRGASQKKRPKMRKFSRKLRPTRAEVAY